ncbi:MAG TPA: CHAT domain-containing protein [Ktedonobacteraceae bacterium]|nr:CHAT domain-containing protein [Ktedonobacteraceae bacterium]
MEMSIYQAIFGEKNNRHTTLCSNLDDYDLLSELEFSTDRPLSPGHWSPYTSGYSLKKYYILLRIAPDKDSLSTRGGWRIAHALIFPQEEISQWSNLMQLIRLLPESPIRQENLLPLKLIESEVEDIIMPAAFPKLVHSLVQSGHTKGTLVWVGNEGFLEALHILWRNVWASARTDISFTSSYRPQDVDDHFKFVATPVEYIDQWREYESVKSSDVCHTSSDVEHLLLGRGDIQNLEVFMRKTGIEQMSLSKIGAIHQAYNYYSLPGWESSLETVRPLARLIARIAPGPASADEIKSQIIASLRTLTIQGTTEDILALRNFDLTPFREQDIFFTSVIQAWATRHFAPLQMEHALDIAKLLEGRHPKNRKGWNESINQVIQDLLANPSTWTNKIARIVWKIWLEKPALIVEVAAFFSNKQVIESYLVSACPRRITEASGKNVQSLATGRKWFRLHAAATAAYIDDIYTALQQQKQVDMELEYKDGIRELVTYYANAKSAPEILEILVKNAEKRSYVVAGELCAQYPALLRSLDFSQSAIVEILINAFQYSESLLKEAAISSEVVYKLLDIWLEDGSVPTNILEQIGHSKYSDLTEYSRRQEVWEPLRSISYNLVKNYLSATAKGWLIFFKKQRGFGVGLEEPLANALRDSLYLHDFISSSSFVDIELILRLFTLLEGKLKVWEFERWFLEKQLYRKVNAENATAIGQFIAENRWESPVRKLAIYVEDHPQSNWTFALEECHHLLFKRRSFFSSLFGPEPFTQRYDRPDKYAVRDREAKMIRVLFLATNPTDTARLRLDKEHRAILERLRSAQADKDIRMEVRNAVRPNDLQEYLLQIRPHVVHFSGHGDVDGRILLENETGARQPVPIEALTNLFHILKENVQVILINACWSKSQAEALSANIDYVIGMSRSISDESAIRFAEGFYRGLGYGSSVRKAFDLGQNNLQLHSRADADVPQILVRPGVDETQPLFNPRY